MSLLFLASVLAAAILLAVASRLPQSLAGYVALIGSGVIAAGVVASFITGDEGGPILLVGGVALVWLHRWAGRDQRRLTMARFARDHGLVFQARSKEALSEDFRLFGRGDGGRARNVIQGQWNGVMVRAMDYDYFVTRTIWVFYGLKAWRRFSVAVLDLGASVPLVITERNGAAGLASDYMGFHDVQLNSDEFNRLFHVTTDDREFAYQFFDLGMLRWLLNQRDLLEAEVQGRRALVALPRLEPDEMDRLFDAAIGFRSHIPRLVRRKYHLAEPVVR
ncbi:MAG TPA: hypothetical protein VGL18_09765 [Actinomycetota bacterium]|jgi:hypothetical protein